MPIRIASLENRVQRVRDLSLRQPRAVERSLYSFPVFSIGRGKVFLWLLDGHGVDLPAFAVRTSCADEQSMLAQAEPELFYRPKYLGRWNWIGMRLQRPSVRWSQVEARIETSWYLTATLAQLRKFLGDRD